MNKNNKIKWVFVSGGECKLCHRTELTELNKERVCFACFNDTGFKLEIKKKFLYMYKGGNIEVMKKHLDKRFKTIKEVNDYFLEIGDYGIYKIIGVKNE